MAEWTVEPLGRDVYRLCRGTETRLAYAVSSGEARWVFLQGNVYVVDMEGLPQPVPIAPGRSGQGAARATKRRKGHVEGALASPMPATVIAVVVEAGQRVVKGDVLVMLEAMKMELPIKAPRDGIIRVVACRPGELVQPGVPLLELE